MTINVKVNLMSGLRSVQKSNVFNIELPDGFTPKSMLSKIGFKDEEIEHLSVFVNEKLVPFKEILKDGDDVWVGIVLGGG